jgi:hypothetical protein
MIPHCVCIIINANKQTNNLIRFFQTKNIFSKFNPVLFKHGLKSKEMNSFDVVKYAEFKVDFSKWKFTNFFDPNSFRWEYKETPFSDFSIPVIMGIFYLISLYFLNVSQKHFHFGLCLV